MSGIFEANGWLLVDMHMFNIIGFPIAACLQSVYWMETKYTGLYIMLYHDWLAMVYGSLQVILHKRDDTYSFILVYRKCNIMIEP